MFQGDSLMPWRTAMQNLRAGFEFRGLAFRQATAQADEWLKRVGLGAGPGSHPIGEFTIDLARPRDVAEIKTDARFVELHAAIWAVLREEVLAGYRQQLAA